MVSIYKIYNKMFLASQWDLILITFRAQGFYLELMNAKLVAYVELQRIHYNLSVNPRIV